VLFSASFPPSSLHNHHLGSVDNIESTITDFFFHSTPSIKYNWYVDTQA
jgi:hypothetical protein